MDEESFNELIKIIEEKLEKKKNSIW